MPNFSRFRATWKIAFGAGLHGATQLLKNNNTLNFGDNQTSMGFDQIAVRSSCLIE